MEWRDGLAIALEPDPMVGGEGLAGFAQRVVARVGRRHGCWEIESAAKDWDGRTDWEKGECAKWDTELI